MEEILSGPEAVSRLFDELREAIEVTYTGSAASYCRLILEDAQIELRMAVAR